MLLFNIHNVISCWLKQGNNSGGPFNQRIPRIVSGKKERLRKKPAQCINTLTFTKDRKKAERHFHGVVEMF